MIIIIKQKLISKNRYFVKLNRFFPLNHMKNNFVKMLPQKFQKELKKNFKTIQCFIDIVIKNNMTFFKKYL